MSGAERTLRQINGALRILRIAGFTISLMVIDSLLQQMFAQWPNDQNYCYHVPFMGCHPFWETWLYVFPILLGLYLWAEFLAWYHEEGRR